MTQIQGVVRQPLICLLGTKRIESKENITVEQMKERIHYVHFTSLNMEGFKKLRQDTRTDCNFLYVE